MKWALPAVKNQVKNQVGRTVVAGISEFTVRDHIDSHSCGCQHGPYDPWGRCIAEQNSTS
jgi:hypothetical protein